MAENEVMGGALFVNDEALEKIWVQWYTKKVADTVSQNNSEKWKGNFILLIKETKQSCMLLPMFNNCRVSQ